MTRKRIRHASSPVLETAFTVLLDLGERQQQQEQQTHAQIKVMTPIVDLRHFTIAWVLANKYI